MKRLNYIESILLITILAGCAILAGCNDAKYSELDTHAYIEEALSGTSTTMTVLAEGETTASLHIHLSGTSATDNHYRLVPDQSALDEYNRVNGVDLLMLPATHYTLPEDITIQAGQYNSETIHISIKAFSQEMIDTGESYGLAVKLEPKNGSVDAMSTTGRYVIATNNIVKFSAPMFDGAADLKADQYDTNSETYAQYTVEVRFQVSNTNRRNRAVFFNGVNDGGGLSDILLRFEDPQSDTEEHKKHSLVQIVGRNSIYLNPTFSFEPNKWQHLALTCDGSNYRLYVNGQFAGVKEIPAGPTTFSDVHWFSDNSWWNGCKILISEARIWSVARTELQIQNNITGTSPKAPGLEAYWRLNEGDGNVFEDATGKGHTLRTGKTPVWIHDILSTDVSTDWE